MKTTINVACAQISATLNDKEANMTKMQKYMKDVKEKFPKTELIIFPELALTGYECNRAEAEQMAESYEESESIRKMGQCAKDLGVYVVFGFAEKGEDGHIYNSAVLVDDNGDPLGVCRKIHLVEEEKEIFSAGDVPTVFDTGIGKIGIMICWDTAFPETARMLTLKGADMIAVLAAWEAPHQRDWDLVNKARAFDNVLYIAGCNQVGGERTLSFFGRSRIVSPIGDELVQVVENEECIVAAELDLIAMQEMRAGYYAQLKDRRPDVYKKFL